MARKLKTGNGDLFIGESGQLRITDKSAEQQSMEHRKVECLGMTFASDDERRKHFTEKLREKLADPAFRKVDGFPVGTDEDILALSDPPYYTACPNPFLGEYIRYASTKRSPGEPSLRPPFATDVSEGKNDPVYTAHSYHTKVPHQAIMRFILHYTRPGDIVLDGFCGTGMTGVAAQLCGAPPPDLKARLEAELPGIEWGERRSILVDLAPFATFIAHNYNSPTNPERFKSEVTSAISEVESDLQWAYRYAADKDGTPVSLVVWSDVYICHDCGRDIVYWGNGIRRQDGAIDPFPCPHCGAENSKSSVEHRLATTLDPILGRVVKQPLQVPVLVKAGRSERAASNYDIQVAERCMAEAGQVRVPAQKMMFRDEPWGDVYRAGYHAGVSHVHHFYNPRQLLVLGRLWTRFRKSVIGRKLQLVLTSFAVRNAFRGNRFVINDHNPNGRINGPLTNCLYFPSLLAEQNIFDLARSKSDDLTAAFRSLASISGDYCLSTQSSTNLAEIPDASVDYVFIDPPFGSNIMYSEMNFLVESWLGCITNNASEAIVNDSQAKNANVYRGLMTDCLREFHRVLKPGRWLTMEFHNSQSAIWNAIQTALGDAGFVIADVRTLDKKKGTVYQEFYVSGATKSDLVISAYRPTEGLERQFRLVAGTPESAWQFVREHLAHLPVFVQTAGKGETVVERQPFLIFDRMVAFHIQRSVSVPLSAAEFYAGLEQRFPIRDGMCFLSDQVAEYDRGRAQVSDLHQLSLFVTDELSAIHWLRRELGNRPQTFQELHPKFMRETQSWAKHERPVELRSLLEQSFIMFDGKGAVPSQVHAYLSSNFKNLRNRPKTDPELVEKASERWFVPDPNKQVDLEKLRERGLLREFETYRGAKERKLKQFRTEAIRAGFRAAYDEHDYKTIVTIAAKLPENVLQEDDKLLMYYDVASMRLGEG